MKIQAFIVFSTILLYSFAQTSLTLDSTTEVQKLTARGKANYKFEIPGNVTSRKSYLVFDVTGTTDSASDPDIFISSVLLLCNSIDSFGSNVD